MTIVRYEPYSMIRQFQNEVNRLFSDNTDTGGALDQSTVSTSQWTPAVDIKEEEERYLITADVPGVKPDEIELTMEKGVLTIKGERKDETETKAEGYRRVERVYGTFYRRFNLPDSTDSESISATTNHGVLEVSIPKKPTLQPRRIEVK